MVPPQLASAVVASGAPFALPPGALVRGSRRRPSTSFAWALLILLFVPLAVWGAEPQALVRVLFVGNSFTHGKFTPVLNYNAASVTDVNFGQPISSPRGEITFGEPPPFGGIPGIFKKFTVQAGLTYDIQLETCSGKGLSYHYTNALSVIAQPNWDVIILQDLSTGPVPVGRGGDPTGFITAVNQLETAIHQQNAATQIWLYQTWARADLTYLPANDYFGEPIETMFDDVRTGYQNALAQNANLMGLIPAGDAWIRAIGSIATPGFAIRNPYTQLGQGMNLWGVDHYHPSKYGAYLNALVIYGRLTGGDPVGIDTSNVVGAELGLTAGDSLVLRQTARDTLVALGQVFSRPAPGKAGSLATR